MNKFLLSLLIIMAATGMARADIASTKYVDEKLPAVGNDSKPVYIDSSGKAAAVSKIATSLLPVAEFANTDLYDNEMGSVADAGLVKGINFLTEADIYYEGENLLGVHSYGPIIQDGIIGIPFAESYVYDYPVPGVVWVADNDETYESALGMSDEWADAVGAEFAGSVVPSVAYMQNEIAANKPNVDTALSTTSTNPVQNKVVTSALNSKQNKIPAVVSDEEDGADVSGFVVIEPDGVVKGVPVQLDSSCDGEDGTVCYVSGIGVGGDDGTADKVAVYESQIKFGNGLVVDFTEESDDPVVTVVSANATIAGVATWGTIPAGSATSTTSAKIWIE